MKNPLPCGGNRSCYFHFSDAETKIKRTNSHHQWEWKLILHPYLSDRSKQSVTCHFPLHTIGNILFILTRFLKLLMSSCSCSLLISRICSLKYFCLKKRNIYNVSLYSVNVYWFIFPVFISWSFIQDFLSLDHLAIFNLSVFDYHSPGHPHCLDSNPPLNHY